MNDESINAVVEGNRRSSRFGLKQLLLLVAVGGILVWAGRRIYDDFTMDVATRQFGDTLRLLQSRDVSERWRAAGNLSRVNGKSQIEPAISGLVHALGDQDLQVRITAARTLGSLVASLQSPDDDTLGLEPELVKRKVDESVLALRKSISDADDSVRIVAIQGLAAVSRQPASMAGGGGGIQGRSPVIPGGAVAKKAGSRPPPERAGAVDNGEIKWSRASARDFYGYLDTSPPPELVTALKDPSPEVRRAAAGAMVNFPLNLDPAIPALFSMAENDDSEVRDACIAALRSAWPTSGVLPTVSEALKSRSDTVSGLAALLLGRIGPEASSAIPALLVVLRQPLGPTTSRSASGRMPSDAASAAARALGSISSSDEVLAALIETLKSDLDYRRGAAAYGLLQLGEPARAAAPALVAAYSKGLKAKDRPATGRLIATALGRFAPGTAAEQDAVTVLNQALESKDSSVSTDAANALARFGKDAARAVPYLRALKENGSPAAGSAAEAALKAIDSAPKPEAGESEPK